MARVQSLVPAWRSICLVAAMICIVIIIFAKQVTFKTSQTRHESDISKYYKDINIHKETFIKIFDIDMDTPFSPYERLGIITKSREFQQLFKYHNETLDSFNKSHVFALTKLLTDKTGILGKAHLKITNKNIGTTKQNQLRTPQSEIVTKVLGNKKYGTFIECGAFDGETASNTLELEVLYGWSGLLIEPNPFYFTQVLGKNRNVHALNACLSSKPVPTLLHMDLQGCAQTCKTKDLDETPKDKDGKVKSVPVPCLPFSIVLQSLNISTVDYFSLDVEGAEYDILQTIPFDKLDIKTLSVEHIHNAVSKGDMLSFMEKQGYALYKEISYTDLIKRVFVEDLFFVKKALVVA